ARGREYIAAPAFAPSAPAPVARLGAGARCVHAQPTGGGSPLLRSPFAPLRASARGVALLHLSNSPADTAIRPQAWCGRRGRTVVLFLPSSPNARGWRAKGAVPRISPWLPGCYRATSRKRPDASLRGCVGDTLARHAASLRFRVHGGRTRPGSHPGRFTRRPP